MFFLIQIIIIIATLTLTGNVVQRYSFILTIQPPHFVSSLFFLILLFN